MQFIICGVVSEALPHDVVGWHHSYLALEGRTITWQLSKRCSPVTYGSSSDGCPVKAPVLRTHSSRDTHDRADQTPFTNPYGTSWRTAKTIIVPIPCRGYRACARATSSHHGYPCARYYGDILGDRVSRLTATLPLLSPRFHSQPATDYRGSRLRHDR